MKINLSLTKKFYYQSKNQSHIKEAVVYLSDLKRIENLPYRQLFIQKRGNNLHRVRVLDLRNPLKLVRYDSRLPDYISDSVYLEIKTHLTSLHF